MMAFQRMAGAVLAACVGISCTAMAADGPAAPSKFTLSPTLPKTMAKASTQMTQEDADMAGWNMFVAFSWPAMPGMRGMPDPRKGFGDPGTVVWETWKSPNEVFYPDGSKPPPWPIYGTPIPQECYDVGARNNGSSPGVLTNILVNRTNQAAGGSLTDQNGNLVHYEITFNKDVFDFIYDNGYYNIAGQNKMTSAVNYPSGTAEMKASWRILMPNEPEAVKQRFLRRTYYVYTPALGPTSPATCGLQEVGLVGMHFNLKVTYADKSVNWLMATFEQVDNVPPFGTPYTPGTDPNHPLPYSLFNKDCYGPQANCIYNQSTEQGRPVTTPVNAIRMVNIDPVAQQLNPQIQAAIRSAWPNSPWQYYEMITTQYPANPNSPPVGNPTPPLSANTTMETYVRQSSCLNCHFTARDINAKYFADYSFMLAQACPKPLFNTANATWNDKSGVCSPNAVKSKQ